MSVVSVKLYKNRQWTYMVQFFTPKPIVQKH